MATNEKYMFERTIQESNRLNFQHDFCRYWTYGHLLHPCIPLDEVYAVADVATGTGVWLLEVRQHLHKQGAHSRQNFRFTGFDISSLQFPADTRGLEDLEFVIHDITTRFPSEYHGKFDIVHLRYLAYALELQHLQKSVEYVSELLRPGGFIQWEEVDIIDVWSSPSTSVTRQGVANIVQEKLARGLILSMPTELIRTILSLSISPEFGIGKIPATNPLAKLNPVSWTNDLLRILAVETYSTHEHPSHEVQKHKTSVGLAANTGLLRASVNRKREAAKEIGKATWESENLLKEAEGSEHLAKEIEEQLQNGEVKCWDANMTCIVARKALILGLEEDWMNANHPLGFRPQGLPTRVKPAESSSNDSA